jgi:hypothetical protein
VVGTWRLVDSQGEQVASIEVSEVDMPWLLGRLTTEPAFDRFRSAFSAELALVEGDLGNHAAEWESTYRTISDNLRLIRPDGRVVPEFLLHVRDSEAWFRYSDEPFDIAPTPRESV